jgi:hypothetical protein
MCINVHVLPASWPISKLLDWILGEERSVSIKLLTSHIFGDCMNNFAWLVSQ